ncbi:tRNA (adenosine(37)-N6)-threonylcarbamoyltransferase complex transferase subunit TsaD [Candidatus Peribacteria bacterium RIFOXYC2_FULL_58_10]|nr:MAG: tRNA (adenosine(37)-N6)-threonylcarbamoyltransferase complex transferase subunit TsaD [Candidatus Peribacteria bacterium RIFOXYC2_FULL_58_10]OGJ84178.1 MAG: tRNA (adenosine(37)-N6)-threonylcarbamoyltransferase complex transferase subunit TsaD [Candidatus Peribacteria bacterium RIFOXYD2_FULL_58_15]
MRILAIETSCDETSASVVENGRKVLSNVISSSSETFAALGGVIPEAAARQQLTCIHPVIAKALTEAGCTPAALDALAVTRGPGLLQSLLVGSTVARTLARLWGKPLIGIHHTFGHLSSPWLDTSEEIPFPILTLSASGGHTELWLRRSHTDGELLGSTRDDAAGEAFDKGAQLLGLPYPGGPAISALSRHGDPHAYPFPSPLSDQKSVEFSFSGLKTSLKYLLRDLGEMSEETRCDVAASYQNALCMHLLTGIGKSLRLHPEVCEVHLVGGVSANIHLRTLVQEQIGERVLRSPKSIAYCTDNAAMVAAAAYFLHQEHGAGAYVPFETAASLPANFVFAVSQ